MNGTITKTGQASLQAAIEASGVELGGITSIEVTAGTFKVSDWSYLRTKKGALKALTTFKIDVDTDDIPNSDGSTGAYFSNKLSSFSAKQLSSIGDYAFMNCSALASVVIPAVEAVGKSAFSSCTNLRSIEVKLTPLTVGQKAFAGCTKLTHARLDVEELNAGVFQNCSALASLELPWVTSIGSAFAGCSALTTLALGSTPPVITSATAFKDCPSVRYLQIDAANQAGYKSVDDGNTTDNLWYGWNITGSPKVLAGTITCKTSSNSKTFANEKSLEDAIGATPYNDIMYITITAGDFLPRDWAFLRAFRTSLTKLISFEISTATEVPNTTSSNPYFGTNFHTFKAPNATSIGDYAFTKCGMQSVELLNVKRVGEGAFANCASLTLVVLPNDTAIGKNAFQKCSKLTNIRLPLVPPTVDASTFSGCPQPRFLQFVKTDGTVLQGNSESLLINKAYREYCKVDDGDNTDELWYGWEINATAEKLQVKINGGSEISAYSLRSAILSSGVILSDITTIEVTAGDILSEDWEYLQYQKNTLKKLDTFRIATRVEIPNSSETYFSSNLKAFEAPEAIGIGSNAFNGCTNITEINLPKVKTIGASAFKNCWRLAEAHLPEAETIGNAAFSGAGFTSINFEEMFPSVTSIGQGVFASNDVLTSVTWKATAIEDFMFVNCTKLIDVDLPSAVTIGQRAFYGCAALESISLPSATTVKQEVFSGCSKLNSVDLPVAKNLGASAFAGCIGLSTISLPAATSISSRAFENCSTLTTVSLPVLTSISSLLFSNCEQLTMLKLKDTPPTVSIDGGKTPFDGCPSPRYLLLVNADGNALTGDALATAQGKYKAVNDGNTSDNLWRGWTLATPRIITLDAQNGQIAIEQGAPAGENQYAVVPELASTVSFTLVPSSGYVAGTVVVFETGNEANKIEVTQSIGTYSFAMPAHDVTIRAQFRKRTYQVRATASPSSAGTVSPSSESYTMGST
ncbi:MAG: leucine-rich repeat domain-containing protein, partial [Bacteroidales bacterium]|nr:leucine-rich repeat domain-containing protein [Bacteroidales bacterium]